MREKAEKQRDNEKEKAEQILEAYGLDRPESELTATFEARAEAHDGVTVERTTRKTKGGPDINPYTRETVWRFAISRRPLGEMFDLLDELSASPPITRLSLLQRESDGSYTLELKRITLPEAPGEPKPAPLPSVPDVSKIPAQWGLCGAGRMRGRIKEIEQEIESLAEDAKATTVAMPQSSTWQAKTLRARKRGALERGGRSIVATVLRKVVEERIPLRAVGVEDEIVVIELRGGADRMKARLRSALPASLADDLGELQTSEDDIARFSLPNPAFEQMKPPGAGERGGIGGLPAPSRLREHHEGHEGHERD